MVLKNELNSGKGTITSHDLGSDDGTITFYSAIKMFASKMGLFLTMVVI